MNKYYKELNDYIFSKLSKMKRKLVCGVKIVNLFE